MKKPNQKGYEEEKLELNKEIVKFLNEIMYIPEELKQIEHKEEIDLGDVVENNDKFIGSQNHHLRNYNENVYYGEGGELKYEPIDDLEDIYEDNCETEDRMFLRTIDVMLRDGRQMMIEVPFDEEVCWCQLDEDREDIYKYLQYKDEFDKWVVLYDFRLETTLVRPSEILSFTIRYEEI